MMCGSTEPRKRKYIIEYTFLSFVRSISNKFGKKLLDTASKTGLHAEKAASTKVVHKTHERRGEFKGNKIVEKIVRSDAN